MPPKPRISVIVPAFNEQDAIESVLGDIPPNLVAEVIVVDNGSTDHTAMRAEAYPDEDPAMLPSAASIGSVLLGLLEGGSASLHGQSIDARDLL